ncbi:MAG: hypothetical protein FJ087_03760 [Deltaproteobacteria bacterium]|nr:hypothetical protein [Deltaproteobacteria bacterium]
MKGLLGATAAALLLLAAGCLSSERRTGTTSDPGGKDPAGEPGGNGGVKAACRTICDRCDRCVDEGKIESSRCEPMGFDCESACETYLSMEGQKGTAQAVAANPDLVTCGSLAVYLPNP